MRTLGHCTCAAYEVMAILPCLVSWSFEGMVCDLSELGIAGT